jgi:hypothetical protein
MSEMKSAYEIAMERLRKKDAEDGVEHTPLTDEQKAAIAEVKQFYQAKLAQQDVLHQASLRKTFDPEERAKLNEDYQREREKFVAERERKIEKIRGQ